MITELVTTLGPLWHERHQAALASRPGKRAVVLAGRRARGGDPRRRRLSGPGCPDRRTVIAPSPQVQKNAPYWYEEMYERQRKAHSSGGSVSSTAPPTWRTGVPYPPLRPPRAHGARRPGRRRSAVSPADRGPGLGTADVNTEPCRSLRRLTPYRARPRQSRCTVPARSVRTSSGYHRAVPRPSGHLVARHPVQPGKGQQPLQDELSATAGQHSTLHGTAMAMPAPVTALPCRRPAPALFSREQQRDFCSGPRRPTLAA